MNQSSFLRCYRLFPPWCLNCLMMILIIGFPQIWQHIQVMGIGPALSSKFWPSNRQSCWYSSWESATIYAILPRGHTGISCIFFQFRVFQGRSHCFYSQLCSCRTDGYRWTSKFGLTQRRFAHFDVEKWLAAERSECNTLIQKELWFCYWIEGQADSES